MSYVIKEHWYRVGAGLTILSTEHPDRPEKYIVVKEYDLIAEAAKLGFDITQPMANPHQVMDTVNAHLLSNGFMVPHVKH